MKEKMEELIKRLNLARDAYYNGTEIINNFNYDEMYDQLEQMEKETGVVLPESPTHSVGWRVSAVSKLNKVTHEFPALSLAKTKDMNEFVKTFFVSSSRGWNCIDQVVLMWKLDGSTVEITYDRNKRTGKTMLSLAATRGSGEIGQDITHNAPFIEGIPMVLPNWAPAKVVVRGEATMSYEEFGRINAELPEGTEQYANPRNLANATISMLDSNEMRKRKIEFHAFEFVWAEDESGADVRPTLFSDSLKQLEMMKFGVVPFEICRVDKQLNAAMIQWSTEDNIKEFGIPVDGLVAAYDRCDLTKNLAGTAHNPHPLKGFAFKWADETAETTLREIEWSASRTGLLNPVAIFDPVDLEGTTVTRATVHNVSEVERLHMHVGDKLVVFKANKIIPAIADNLTLDRSPLYIPTVCPVCGCSTNVVTSKIQGSLTKTLWCENPNCAAKHIGRFVHFCERDCMNIEGLSEATIEKFVDAGFLKEFADFYKLNQHKDEIIVMDGFGQKSYDNMMEAINHSRNASFIGFIHALGIQNIGKGQAKLFSKAYSGDVMKFFNDIHERHNFTYIEGIGEVLQDNLLDWGNKYLGWIPFKEDASSLWNSNLEIYSLMKELSFKIEEKGEIGEQKLIGKTFVITGSVEYFPNRDAIKNFIETKGGKTSGSVSAKTSFLINNDVTSTSGKNKKAQELGIPIISEHQLLDMVNK